MKHNKFCMNRSDGGVSIATVSDGADIETVVQKWQESHPPGNANDPLSGVTIISFSRVENTEIPASRSDREAWIFKDGGVRVDAEKSNARRTTRG